MKSVIKNKKIVFVIAIIIVIIFAIALILDLRTESGGLQLTYRCEDNSLIQVVRNEKTALVTLAGGKEYELKRASGSDGYRYQSNDGLNQIWDQSGEMVFKENGENRYTSCILVESVDTNNDLINFSDWSTYQSDYGGDYEIEFKYPSSAEINDGNKNLELLYGENNEKNEGLRDGFTVKVEMLTADQASELIKVVPSSEVEQVNFYDYEAQSFAIADEKVLAVVQNTLVKIDENNYAIIKYSVAGTERNNDYYVAISEIFKTMTFLSKAELADAKVRSEDAALVSNVSIALLKEPTGTPGFGCDDVVFVSKDILPTKEPLDAAMKTLFSAKDEFAETGQINFIARTNGTLKYERATIKGGVATIYLNGALSGVSGVCDEPRAQIQIEQTALKFDSVNSVLINFNGEITDDLSAELGLRG